MRTRIVIQARVGSSRLPGKILKFLGGRPLLEQVVRRLSACRQHLDRPAEVQVATTKDAADDATEALCRALGVPCFRGSREDVLARYVAAAADLADGDVLVRATADNPLYCPRRTALLIERHLESRNDYTCVRNLSYVVPEAMRVGALRAMAGLVAGAADADYCREHVTPYFRRAGAPFRVEQLPEDWHGVRPDVRLTVDTPAEHERMAALFAAFAAVPGMPASEPTMSLEEVYRQWDASQLPSGRHPLIEPPAAA